ncbi:MAG: cob(I)yrinic acid a,c-diamide adenosyltransferase [Chloroflexi bacterium]|nr:cob(I)yrinic acid a,c-diamide adenosyltransferase [Chloroflexota bacterium]MCH8065013.1 cob(I)yrinic acid a,c-diamide adenosyltransferase [Chloroflexota bacterium]
MPVPKRRSKSKLYTRTGDGGETGLFGGRRVQKDDLRVMAYGTIDELNAALGLAISFIRQRTVIARLHTIQNELFNIGAELASDQPVRRGKKQSTMIQLEASKTAWLEELIDDYDARVPPLRTFVLPSGTSAASALHLARTVCRRAEREVVTLAQRESVNPAILAYLNRLCDLLFVLARYLNKAARRRELLWSKDV